MLLIISYFLIVYSNSLLLHLGVSTLGTCICVLDLSFLFITESKMPECVSLCGLAMFARDNKLEYLDNWAALRGVVCQNLVYAGTPTPKITFARLSTPLSY